MSDLAGFLNARLDEDEAWAANPECDQDPARVLREVEAKRKIISYAQAPMVPPHERSYLLEHMAAVYSDHPDYDPAWA